MASGLVTTTRRKREKVASLDVTASNLSVDLYKSKVWNYYTKLGDAYVECKVCKKQLSSHNNTAIMREHLVRRHSFRSVGLLHTKEPLELDFPDQEGTTKRLRQTLPINGLCQSVSDSRTQVVTNLLLEMIYLDLHPLSVVEDKGFCLLLGVLEPNVVLPCPTQLAGMLWHKYAVIKEQLKCCLQAAQSVVLSVESWTNHSKMSCLAITANVIDDDWRLCRFLLETQPVLQSKTEENLAKRLYSVLEEFGLSSTLISSIVFDRSGSLSAHAEPLKDTYGWTSLCCTSHILQLCVQAGLEVQEVSEALCAARGLVYYFQEDFKASCYLNAKLEAMNKPRLVLDSQMYWISTLAMCQNLLDLKWAILSILEEQTVQNLSEQHWKLLQDLVPMLKTIWIATEFLQEEQNASISSLMPCVHGILTVVGQTSEGSNSIIKAAASEIRAEICRYWDMLDEGKLITNPSVIASFLDPRFKDLRFLKPWARGELHARVRNTLLQMCEPPTKQPWTLSCAFEGGTETSPLSTLKDRGPTVGSENVYDLLLGKDPTEGMPEAHHQLENYILEPICKRTIDPLGWWKSNLHRFPALALLARQYLAIPVTVVKPAHAFSTKLGPLAKRRAALETKHMDQILFLHQNIDFLERGVKATQPPAPQRLPRNQLHDEDDEEAGSADLEAPSVAPVADDEPLQAEEEIITLGLYPIAKTVPPTPRAEPPQPQISPSRPLAALPENLFWQTMSNFQSKQLSLLTTQVHLMSNLNKRAHRRNCNITGLKAEVSRVANSLDQIRDPNNRFNDTFLKMLESQTNAARDLNATILSLGSQILAHLPEASPSTSNDGTPYTATPVRTPSRRTLRTRVGGVRPPSDRNAPRRGQ